MSTYIVHVSSRSNALYKFKNDLFYSLRLLAKETNLAMMLFFNHEAVSKCLQVIQMKLQQFPHRRPVTVSLKMR